MFRTELPLTPHPAQLPHSARVLTIGSCFSDTIGSRLAQYKVSTLANPFGTVFNPVSACQLLRAAAGEDVDWQQHLVEARGRWQSYDLPAEIGADSPVTLLQQIQDVVRQTGEFLQTADVVVLTLGTAFAYRLLETDELVGNCHKIPAEKFEKELLTPDEVINAVAETHAYLRLQNPKLRFILTVSPVRHLKDTLPLNAVSKSVLRVACHYLSELLPDVSYFPAYELLLDDLRDYRFYAADMLHPSEVAENYIWERFTRTYFDQSFGRFKKEWESVRQALGHRPLYSAAPEHRTFLESTLERLHKLASQADVRPEIQEVEEQLAALPMPVLSQPQPEAEPDDDEERIDIGEGSAPVAVPGPRREPQRPVQPIPQPAPQPESVAEAEDADEVYEPQPVDEAAEAILEIDAPEDLPGAPKKKRRSRGGAKRTARKNAARAALEATQQPAGSVSTAQTVAAEPIESVTPEVVAAVESGPEVPLLTQELEVLHELPPVPVSEPEPTPALPEPDRPTRPMAATPTAPKAPNVDWLVPMKDGDIPLPKRQSKGIVRTPPTRKATQPIATPPKSGSRKKPAAALPAAAVPEAVALPAAEIPTALPQAEVLMTAPAMPPVVEAAAVETPAAPPVEAPAVEPVAAAEQAVKAKAPAKPKPKASVKSAAKPAAKAPAAAKPEQKAATKPAAKPKSKAATAPASRRKPAAPVTEAPAPPVPQPASPADPVVATPPKRVRPPRKKPAAPDENA